MMKPEELQFLSEANHIEAADKLADIAITLFGDDAGALLVSAALKAYERTDGKDNAFKLIQCNLQTIVNAVDAKTQYQ